MRLRHRRVPASSKRRAVGEGRNLLRADRARGPPLNRLAGRPVVQRQQVAVRQHRDLGRPPRLFRLDVLRQRPVQLALGERRVVPRQRRQNLRRIARRRLVGLAQHLRPLHRLRARPPHPHRADMRAGMRRRRIHPDVQAVLPEIGPEGPSVRKRTVRNENTDENPTISTGRRRFCCGAGTNWPFVACNHGVQMPLN